MGVFRFLALQWSELQASSGWHHRGTTLPGKLLFWVLLLIFVLIEWNLVFVVHWQPSGTKDMLLSSPSHLETYNLSSDSQSTLPAIHNNNAPTDLAIPSTTTRGAAVTVRRGGDDDDDGGKNDVVVVANSMHQTPMKNNNELIHRGFFGLGHRLHRAAAAWHLAKALGEVTRFRFQWGSCDGDKATEKKELLGTSQEMDYDIFRYLFGNDVWDIPSNLSDSGDHINPTSALENRTNNQSIPVLKMIVIRNDVYGYVKGQLYKDLQLPVAMGISTNERQENSTAKAKAEPSPISGFAPFKEKLSSDIQFYKVLSKRYRHMHQVDDFMREHKFHKRFVVGLHLRTGNGEGMHFEDSGRHVSNETEFVVNLVKLIGNFVKSNIAITSSSTKLEDELVPLIFLATDTAYLIPVVEEASRALPVKIGVVVLPQDRLEANQGVTFSALEGAGQRCLQGWQDMVSDMMLLSRADVVVAAKFSTFTQSLPLALVLDQGRPFCEVSEKADSMTCLHDMETWMFRHKHKKMATYTTLVAGGQEIDHAEAVPHRLTLLLPDVVHPAEFGQAQSFLADTRKDSSTEAIFVYGRSKIYRKYRNEKPMGESKWNFL